MASPAAGAEESPYLLPDAQLRALLHGVHLPHLDGTATPNGSAPTLTASSSFRGPSADDDPTLLSPTAALDPRPATPPANGVSPARPALPATPRSLLLGSHVRSSTSRSATGPRARAASPSLAPGLTSPGVRSRPTTARSVLAAGNGGSDDDDRDDRARDDERAPLLSSPRASYGRRSDEDDVNLRTPSPSPTPTNAAAAASVPIVTTTRATPPPSMQPRAATHPPLTRPLSTTGSLLTVDAYHDDDPYWKDVCLTPDQGDAPHGIGFDVLEHYLHKLAKRSVRSWKPGGPVPPPHYSATEPADATPVRAAVQENIAQIRRGKFVVRGTRLGKRFMFFSLADGVVLAATLEELVLGSFAARTPPTLRPQRRPSVFSMTAGAAGAAAAAAAANARSPPETTVPMLTPPTAVPLAPEGPAMPKPPSVAASLADTPPPPLHEMLARPVTWWIDVEAPTPEEMKLLSRVFHIHPLTVEDIFQGVEAPQETREKVELFSNYYFAVIKTFDHELVPFNFYLIVFPEGILTLHFPPAAHPSNVIKRISQLADYGFSLTPAWISYAIIDDITDSYGPVLRLIETEVDTIDDLVLVLRGREQTDMLQRIGRARKQVMLMLRLLSTKADAVKALMKRVVAGDDTTALYMGDIQDHVLTMLQNLTYYDKTLARAHSNYLAQISIEITQSNERMNNVVAKLTIVASVMVPLNLITGLWGMNVKVPGQDIESESWFYLIVSGMAVFVTTLLVWIRRGGLL
ncbi:CorA metal ion transporter [Allomyces javanicus]|nr:CorA metal ion transporter [Allomyces javanicus]